MNKEAKGLIKYVLIMLITFLMPLCMFYFVMSALYYEDLFLSYLNLSIALVLLILYFVLPIIFTYKAMKFHWSNYLDKFFYNKFAPTIGLLAILLIMFILNRKNSLHYEDVLYFLLPYYAVVYITILVCQLRRLSK